MTTFTLAQHLLIFLVRSLFDFCKLKKAIFLNSSDLELKVL